MEGLVVDGAFWRGRRVLLTGHTGFKGGWLALWLQRLGAQVTGYALSPGEASVFELARIAEGMRDVRGDIRDLTALRSAVAEAAPEIIIHMAAQSLVRRSYAEPVETYTTNVMGTLNVLEAARAATHARALVVVTSDKCYADDGTGTPHREADPLGGNDPYSSSKACAELVASAYRRSYLESHLPLATVRAGNVIGGGDWAEDRLVPDAIRAFVAGRPLEVRNPTATRPWPHVLEPLCAYLVVAERLWSAGGAFAQAWNIGPDASHPVAQVATRLAALWGGSARWEPRPGTHPQETAALALDASRARRLLRWTPRSTLEEALDWTIDWYRTWHDGGDVRRVTEAQLERFSARLT